MSEFIRETLMVGGLLAVGVGLTEISPALAWIYGGLAAVALGYAAHVRGRVDNDR